MQVSASHFSVPLQTALELNVPHLQTSLRHFGLLDVDTQASTFCAHLQMPFPLFAVISQYAPVDIPSQVAKDAVHLQTGAFTSDISQ